MFAVNDGIEGVEDFLLQCPSYVAQRRDLLAKVTDVLRPFIDFTDLCNEALV